MFGSLGMPELIFILVLALLVFGPKRLPDVGRTLGKGLREFRRATSDLKRTVETEMATVDIEPTRPTPARAPVARETESSAEPAAEQAGAEAGEPAPEQGAAEAEEPVATADSTATE